MDDDKTRDVPIPGDLGDRCSLDPAALDQRLGEIEQLTRWALRDRRESAEGTVLTFDLAAAPQVRDLVSRERTCCGHLEFGVEETDDSVRLAIRSRSDEALERNRTLRINDHPSSA